MVSGVRCQVSAASAVDQNNGLSGRSGSTKKAIVAGGYSVRSTKKLSAANPAFEIPLFCASLLHPVEVSFTLKRQSNCCSLPET